MEDSFLLSKILNSNGQIIYLKKEIHEANNEGKIKFYEEKKDPFIPRRSNINYYSKIIGSSILGLVFEFSNDFLITSMTKSETSENEITIWKKNVDSIIPKDANFNMIYPLMEEEQYFSIEEKMIDDFIDEMTKKIMNKIVQEKNSLIERYESLLQKINDSFIFYKERREELLISLDQNLASFENDNQIKKIADSYGFFYRINSFDNEVEKTEREMNSTLVLLNSFDKF